MIRRQTAPRQPLGPLRTAAAALIVALLTMALIWTWMIACN